MGNPAWMTVQDLADRWQVSHAVVRLAIRDGRLRALKFSAKVWRISLDAVEQFEQTQEVKPAHTSSIADRFVPDYVGEDA